MNVKGDALALKQSGCYIITCLLNGKRYIGSSSNIWKRYLDHCSDFRSGQHVNPHLQAAYSKYGESCFLFEAAVLCSEADVLEVEQLLMDSLQSYDSEQGYNVCTKAGRLDVESMSIQDRERIYAARKQGMEASRAFHDSCRNPEFVQKRQEGIRLYYEGRKAAGLPYYRKSRSGMTDMHKNIKDAWSNVELRERQGELLKRRWADPVWKEQELARRRRNKAAAVVVQ